MITPLPKQLEESLRGNPAVSQLFEFWPELNLPNCWLVAGVIVQGYWNTVHGFPPLKGVSDIDIVYFNSNDLTEDAEAGHSGRIARRFKNLDIAFDVKNEARVHLWYEARFGYPISPYNSVESAIDTFPTTAGAIGIRPVGDKLGAYAPFGFDDFLNLIVRPNKRQITRSIYTEKVSRWLTQWPRLEVIEWDKA